MLEDALRSVIQKGLSAAGDELVATPTAIPEQAAADVHYRWGVPVSPGVCALRTADVSLVNATSFPPTEVEVDDDACAASSNTMVVQRSSAGSVYQSLVQRLLQQNLAAVDVQVVYVLHNPLVTSSFVNVAREKSVRTHVGRAAAGGCATVEHPHVNHRRP